MRAIALVLALFGTPAAAGNVGLAVHGNWCGPGHGGGPALDVLDAACRRHDLCVGRAGAYFDCDCDLAFMTELRHLRWPSEALYQKGRSVYEAIALTPCSNAEGQAKKLEWVANDRFGALLSGREPPFSSIGRFLRMLSEGKLNTR